MLVRVKLTGKSDEYFIEIFDEEGYKFRGGRSEDFGDELEPGDYNATYHVRGTPDNKVTLKFTGVREPKKGTERTIPQKGFFSDNRAFKV